MNIDKDIEHLQNKINEVNRKFTHEEVLKNIEAIEHIISELETYKKIVDFMTEIVKKQNVHYAYGGITQCIAGNPVIKLCDGTKCKQCIIDWARKEVEKDD